MTRALRVLHCPTAVGGNAPQLARAERELGLKSQSVVLGANPFQYGADEVIANRLVAEGKRWQILWRALREFDLIHFNYGRSLFPPLVTELGPTSGGYGRLSRALYHSYARLLGMNDLPLLHAAGKGIVVTFQGGDARQSGYAATTFGARRKRWVIRKFARYADRMFYLNPDLGRFLPSHAEFLPYANVDLREWQASRNAPTARPLRVVHAPSDRIHKGTEHVVTAVDALRRDGVELDFTLAEGLARQDARRLYEQADVLVDQLLAGWYGGLAVECMALGKPVVCYIREEDLRFLPDEMRAQLPIIGATPASLADVLRQCAERPRHELAAIGMRGRAYVERWHDPHKIAARLKCEYEAVVVDKRARRPRAA